MSARNTQIRMKRHPDGMVTEDDFDIVVGELPALEAGEVLVRNHYLSLDPYMRPRMDPWRSYVAPLTPGDLMPGGTVGEVIESRSSELQVGTRVAAMLGWQAYGVATPAAVRVIDRSVSELTAALSVLGMTGVTAHYGMLKIARPIAGETVVVTAASGAVGGVAGQIARIMGCRTVGIAGGPEKCRFVVDELGFDQCIDYRAPDFEAQLAAATPDYIDVLFENVGGPVMDACLARVNDFARVALCGNISQYNASDPYGVKRFREVLLHRVTIRAFVIADHRDHWPVALADLTRWVREGRVRFREDVVDGLENAPQAFIRMLTGQNFGKQLVRIAS
jgi:NADPH-dependent curcumin reductase